MLESQQGEMIITNPLQSTKLALGNNDISNDGIDDIFKMSIQNTL